MRKEIITCDRCKAMLRLDEPEGCPRQAKGRDACAGCYVKYINLNKWFDDEMEKWIDGKESALDNV